MGPASLSKQELEWQQSWKHYNPGWKHVLWNDEKINEKLNITHPNILHECKNFSEKSDILRFEILYQFGGLYIDTDFECLKPIDPLFINRDFLIFRESRNDVCGAFFAASRNNSRVKKIIDGLPDRQRIHGKAKANIKFGPKYLHEMLPGASVDNNTRLVYPYMWNEKHRRNENFAETSPESYAVHHWKGSWKGNQDRRQRPKQIWYTSSRKVRQLLSKLMKYCHSSD